MAILGDDVTVLASLKLSADQMRAELERVKMVSEETGLSMDRAVRATVALQSAHAKAAVDAAKLTQSQGALSTQTGQLAVVANQALDLWSSSVGIGRQVIGTWVDLAQEGARLEDLYGAMSISIADAALATKGFVRDSALAESAARLTVSQLQFSEEEFTKFTGIVAKLADAQGKDIPAALEAATAALVNNTERGIKDLGLLIDRKAAVAEYAMSLGIATSKLTEAQERQALWNAVLVEGAKSTRQLGLDVEGVGEAMERVSVSWQNLTDALSRRVNIGLSKDFVVLEQLRKMLDFWADVFEPEVKGDRIGARAVTGGADARLRSTEEAAALADIASRARSTEERAAEEARLRAVEGARRHAAEEAAALADIASREVADRAKVREAELERREAELQRLMETAGGVSPIPSDEQINALAMYTEGLREQTAVIELLGRAEEEQAKARAAHAAMGREAIRQFITMTGAAVIQAGIMGKGIGQAFEAALSSFGDYLIGRGMGLVTDAIARALFSYGADPTAVPLEAQGLAMIALGGTLKAGTYSGGGGGGRGARGGIGRGQGSPSYVVPPGGVVAATGPPQAIGGAAGATSITVNVSGLVGDPVATGRQIAIVLEEMMRSDGGPREFPRGRRRW